MPLSRLVRLQQHRNPVVRQSFQQPRNPVVRQSFVLLLQLFQLIVYASYPQPCTDHDNPLEDVAAFPILPPRWL